MMLNTQLACLSNPGLPNFGKSFIKFKPRPNPGCNAKSSFECSQLQPKESLDYRKNDADLDEDAKCSDSEILYAETNFETYKQLKAVAKGNDPSITKQEIYEKLLKPFKHEKCIKYDQASMKSKVYYY